MPLVWCHLVQVWELVHKEGWVPKNWCFPTVVLEQTLENPLDCKEINQSILKEISPEYSLEGLMLKLKLQYFGHLMWRTNSLEKTLMLGKIEDKRRRGNQGGDGWMASSTQWTWVWADSERGNSVLQQTLKDREPCCAAVNVLTKGWTWLSNWTSSMLAQLVKNPPAMWETWVWSLGWEDPPEKGKATHSSILAWRIPWTVWSMGLQRVRQDRATLLLPATE